MSFKVAVRYDPGGAKSLASTCTLLLAMACSQSRRDQAVGSGPGLDAVGASASESGPAPPRMPPRKETSLCRLAPPRGQVPLPSVEIGSIQAAGETALDSSIVVGHGKWTFINVWATHCQVCLLELPLLAEWERRLERHMRVAYVNVDEDAAPAAAFLASQPKSGVRRSYRIKDFAAQARWLMQMGMPTSLPSQVIVDPEGIVRCVSLRPVDANDFPEVEALVGMKRAR